MGSITVHFSGVCTHIVKQPETPWLPTPHRVLLVNAIAGRAIPDGGVTIPPHEPLITIDPAQLVHPDSAKDFAAPFLPVYEDEPGTWTLLGVNLTIANPTGPYARDWRYLCGIPKLTTLDPMLGLLSGDFVVGSRVNNTAAYFDVTSGGFTAFLTSDGAAAATAVITTVDDNPQLVATSFDTLEQRRLIFNDGATIVVSNEEPKPTSNDDDFLLNYLIARNLSATKPPIPPQSECLLGVGVPNGAKVPRSAFSIGPGCSNSNYP